MFLKIQKCDNEIVFYIEELTKENYVENDSKDAELGDFLYYIRDEIYAKTVVNSSSFQYELR